MMRVLAVAAAGMLLAACGEQPQTAGGAKSDQAPHTGSISGSAFAEKSWKPGDRTSWEQQLRARTQAGQNDYAKAD